MRRVMVILLQERNFGPNVIYYFFVTNICDSNIVEYRYFPRERNFEFRNYIFGGGGQRKYPTSEILNFEIINSAAAGFVNPLRNSKRGIEKLYSMYHGLSLIHI